MEAAMRRLFLLLTLVFVIGGGAVYVSAQGGTAPQTDEVDVGADASGCATPVGSPSAERIEELLATAVASPEVIEDLEIALASPDASPVVFDPCATPVVGTPAS
jgi:hypothetical protein